MYKTMFELDGWEYFFEGYTNGARWNGWATPYFSKEVADRVVEFAQWEEGDYMKYDEENDRYIVVEGGEITEEIKGENCVIDGKELHLYPIGAWCWIWNEITDYQSEEGKIVWDYLAEEDHYLNPKQLYEVYYGIVQEINGYMSVKELKIFTDGFMAAYDRWRY